MATRVISTHPLPEMCSWVCWELQGERGVDLARASLREQALGADA